MALITCPECGREVSDKAEICIHCGFPLQKERKKGTQATGVLACFEQFASNATPLINKLEEIYPNVKSAVTITKAENNEDITNDILAREIIEGLSKVTPFCSWINVKMFCEMIRFDLVSPEAMAYISDILIRLISEVRVNNDGSKGRPNIMLFFYPLHNILLYTDEWHKEKLMVILSEQYFGKQTGYDFIESMYKEHCRQTGEQQLARFNSQNSTTRINLKCPVCGSTNIKRISNINRITSIVAIGLASSKIGKQYECKSCRHKW